MGDRLALLLLDGIASAFLLILLTSSVLVASAEDSSTLVLPLVGEVVNAESESGAVLRTTTYSIPLAVGSPPQTMEVLVDTGSTRLWLPSEGCLQRACAMHRRYMSKSASGISRAQTSVTFATGVLTGRAVEDQVCVGESALCLNMSFMVADDETEFPFVALPFDGVLGLAPPAGMADPADFLPQLLHEGVEVFATWMGHVPDGKPVLEAGQVAFIDSAHAQMFRGSSSSYEEAWWAGPYLWLDMPPDATKRGYWLLSLASVRIGSNVIVNCSEVSCAAAVDTGSTWMMAPEAAMPTVESELGIKADCGMQVRLPDMYFDVEDSAGNKAALRLPAADYVDHVPSDRHDRLDCALAFGALEGLSQEEHLWVFGQPLLRNYIIAYDLHHLRVGFREVLPGQDTRKSEQEERSSLSNLGQQHAGHLRAIRPVAHQQ